MSLEKDNSVSGPESDRKQPKPGLKKNKNSVVVNLVVLLCMLIGFANWWSDDKLEKYHNEFAAASYNSVFADKWNQFVEINNRPDLTGPMMQTQLQNTLLPEIKLRLKEASEIDPPEFAENFHSDYTGRLRAFSTETESLINAINAENWTLAKDKILTINKIVALAEGDITKLKEKLKSERNFTFK